MDEKKQEKYRKEAVEKYELKAWECLALYSYHGVEYAKQSKMIKELEDRVKVFEQDIRNIENLPDHHTVENREKVKALRKDVSDYKKRITGVAPTMKKMFDEISEWQQLGAKYIMQAEHMSSFKLKTPEEIAEAKKGPAPEQVVADDSESKS